MVNRLLGAVLVFAGGLGFWWVADRLDGLLGWGRVPPFDFWTLGRPFIAVSMGVGALLGVAWSRRQGTTTGRVKGGKLTTLGVTTGLTNAGVTPGFTVGKPRQGDGTQSCVVTLPPGVITSKVKGLREHVAAAHRVPMDRVTVAPDGGRADRVRVTLTDELPVLKPRQPAIEREVRWSDPVLLGRDTRGRDLTIPTYDVGLYLFCGQTSSGKTTAARLPVLHYALDPDAVLWGCDGKGDLNDWEDALPRFNRWVPLQGNPDPGGDYVRLLEDVAAEVDRRYTTRGRTDPGMLVLLEEAANFLDRLDPDQVKTAGKLLTRVVQTCRAANVLILVSTQRPAADLLPTNVRAQAGVKLCMRMRSLTDAEMALGYRPDDDWVLTAPKGHGLLDTGDGARRVWVDGLPQQGWEAACKSLPPVVTTGDVGEPDPVVTPPVVSPLLTAVGTALTAAGRPLTATELWNALPAGLRGAGPKQLGGALSKAGVTARRTNKGSLYDVDALQPALSPPGAVATPGGA